MSILYLSHAIVEFMPVCINSLNMQSECFAKFGFTEHGITRRTLKTNKVTEAEGNNTGNLLCTAIISYRNLNISKK